MQMEHPRREIVFLSDGRIQAGRAGIEAVLPADRAGHRSIEARERNHSLLSDRFFVSRSTI
jgi:hypothetical protein